MRVGVSARTCRSLQTSPRTYVDTSSPRGELGLHRGLVARSDSQYTPSDACYSAMVSRPRKKVLSNIHLSIISIIVRHVSRTLISLFIVLVFATEICPGKASICKTEERSSLINRPPHDSAEMSDTMLCTSWFFHTHMPIPSDVTQDVYRQVRE